MEGRGGGGMSADATNRLVHHNVMVKNVKGDVKKYFTLSAVC